MTSINNMTSRRHAQPTE